MNNKEPSLQASSRSNAQSFPDNNNQMETQDLASQIVSKALECGFDNCGIIPVSALDGYKERLAQRRERFPEAKPLFDNLEGFTKIAELYPWAKSVIVCTIWIGKYRFPKPLRKRYAKSFILSFDPLPNSDEFIKKKKFEQWLDEMKVRFCGGLDNLPARIFPLRLAAVEAGLGIFRQNNFFYAERGSWYNLEGYLIDKECELRQKCELRPCSPKCTICRNACKTKALVEPFCMNPLSCVSFWTTFGGGAVPGHLTPEQFGTWICGCDDCQDSCPYNRHDWDTGEPFPGLEEISELLTPENLIAATNDELVENVVPKTDFHISPEHVETLKVCAQRSICNAAAQE